ncbi:diguanylate cyclase [Anaeromicrobium sediminis]|nr:GGDEF domain-containing protein [Anaeromicrobium sediminis]
MLNNFICVDVCDGILKVERMITEKKLDMALVFEGGTLVGLLTYKDLLKSHPNRIVADAMNTNIIFIDPNSSIWHAKETFDKQDTSVLVVMDNYMPMGFITDNHVYVEIGRYIDSLTNLYKTNYIFYKADEIIRTKTTLGIIFIDVNNFGYIDKHYGHSIGDVILKEISYLLKNSIPKDTYICRFGGDEFVLVTPYEKKNCTNLARELSALIAGHKFIKDIRLTISCGIVSFDSNNNRSENYFSHITNLINMASLASTKAKKENAEISVATNLNQLEMTLDLA